MIALDDGIFYPLEKNHKRKLLSQLKESETAFVEGLGELSTQYNLESTIETNRMLWTDSMGKDF